MAGRTDKPKSSSMAAHSGHFVRFLVLVTYILLSWTPCCHCQDASLVFVVAEEQSAGQYVGSVSSSPNVLSMVESDERANLRYSILSDASGNSELFRIDTISGNILLAKRADRETVCPTVTLCEISFRVAVNGAPNFFTIPVRIDVTDINDNSPTFPPPASMNVHVSEAASENFTQTLTPATDADSSPEFGVKSYAIEPPSELFRVEVTRNFVGTSQVSLVLQQKLDRETRDRYNLTVVARDGGSPPRSGTLVVNVVVDDVNDNDPVFADKFYSANFSEEAVPGYKVITVAATDLDMGDNGRVVYELGSVLSGGADLQEKIIVDNVTGAVILRKPLVSGEYRFVVNAHDLGNPPRSDQAMISLTVLDTVNDQPIVRLNPVQVGNLPLGWVSEGSEVNTVVAVISVDDPDSGSNGEVTCDSLGPVFQLQPLEAGRYKLVLAQRLDRETSATYTVKVACQDGGNPSLNATSDFDINVSDINDNKPEFENLTYVQYIPENNAKGDVVGVVRAVDKDEGENAALEYRLVAEDGNFTVVPETGVILANRRFDREQDDQYQFQVLATDQGDPALTATATVTVHIQDVNDVAPIFSQETYSFQLYEARDSGSSVGDVTFTDPDLGEGRVVSLSLKPARDNEYVPFSISGEGRLSSLDRFDREERDVYSFYVVAADHGSQQLSSSAQVVVHILDVNDNPPVFLFPSDQNFSAYVNVPIKQDTLILQVNAYDADGEQNSAITFTISASNASDLFIVGAFSGEVIANRDLHVADAGSYVLTINVTDHGVPAMWDTRNLHILLQPENASPSDMRAAERYVLIVACIVSFTIVVCGAVVVTICTLRRHDHRAKLESRMFLSDKRPDNAHKQARDDKQGLDKPVSLSISCIYFCVCLCVFTFLKI